MTTADGKITATFDDMNYVNNMYLCGDKLLLDDYEKVYEYDTATDKKTAEHEALASVITSKGSDHDRRLSEGWNIRFIIPVQRVSIHTIWIRILPNRLWMAICHPGFPKWQRRVSDSER